MAEIQVAKVSTQQNYILPHTPFWSLFQRVPALK